MHTYTRCWKSSAASASCVAKKDLESQDEASSPYVNRPRLPPLPRKTYIIPTCSPISRFEPDAKPCDEADVVQATDIQSSENDTTRRISQSC